LADADSKDDLEAPALRQVARRIESLMSKPGSEADPGTPDDAAADEGFGWEESVLRRLRARLFSDELSD
jgi:hypothetical protein